MCLDGRTNPLAVISSSPHNDGPWEGLVMIGVVDRVMEMRFYRAIGRLPFFL